MAQIPWRLKTYKPISRKTAAHHVAKCLAELSQIFRSANETLSQMQILNSAMECAEEDPSCFFLANARGTVFLHPVYTDDPLTGIRIALSNFLLKFLPEFRGHWLSFRHVKLTDDNGHIADGDSLGMMTCDVSVEAVVLRTMRNQRLLGKVTHIRENHIAILYEGIYNAMIPIKLLENRYTYTNVTLKGKDTKDGNIKRGNSIIFQIEKLNMASNGDIANIEGKMRNRQKTYSLRY
eukprot:GHVO01016384.1.p1 GENE.GHVO01016384.1~~GHVO01016384.1.p1  ORF type:complete len:236 (+),score=25.60 GHVO01016384.1:47-754(+)